MDTDKTFDFSGICDDCARLLREPLRLVQEGSLPDHICSNAMRQSTKNWMLKFSGGLLGEVWPLPVGKAPMKRVDKLLKEQESMLTEQDWEELREFINIRRIFVEGTTNMMPFDGSEEAAFLLELPLADGVLTFFGLCEYAWYCPPVIIEPVKEVFQSQAPEEVENFEKSLSFFWPHLALLMPDSYKKKAFESLSKNRLLSNFKDDLFFTYKLAGCKFTYAGDNPTSNEVKTAVDTLRRWWAAFAGKEIVGITGPGRPKGTRVLSKEDIIIGYKNYIKQHGNPPSKEALGYYLRVDRSTIYATFKAYNLPWPLEL